MHQIQNKVLTAILNSKIYQIWSVWSETGDWKKTVKKAKQVNR